MSLAQSEQMHMPPQTLFPRCTSRLRPWRSRIPVWRIWSMAPSRGRSSMVALLLGCIFSLGIYDRTAVCISWPGRNAEGARMEMVLELARIGTSLTIISEAGGADPFCPCPRGGVDSRIRSAHAREEV